ncbi:MAG: hypothetical protein JWM21_2032 [Acidobacteria bacterium]|nr:hypothetical protein [Acidobacteriota bacterium]
MIPGTEGDAIIGIDPNQFHGSLSERDRIRFRLLGEMMETYGPSVGNIIAQQYGLSSEALDVTGDPKIAAFFATRQYPEYQSFEGNASNSQGVIYRFPLVEILPDLETLDTLYRLACKRIDPFGDVWFVGFQKRAVLTDKILKDVNKIFEERGGTIRAEVRTRPLVVDHGFYEREIRASWRKRLMDEVPPLTDTRLLRQRGGSIRTISRWASSVAVELDAVKHPNLGFVFSPPFAIGEELIGVENINRYPKLEIFPFTHSAYEVDLSPDYLWPGEESDWMYKHLMTIFENRHFQFLQKQNVSVDDLREGLIDPGYQRSTDDAKTGVQ